MSLFRMKSFISSKILFLCALWCIYAVPLQSQPSGTIPAQQTWIPPLGNHFEKALFKGSLDISKHHLTGLLFFKQTSDTSFRIIFTNEMGMKYFDFEFVRDRFVVQYCFPSLSKKALLKIFEADFRLLLPDSTSVQNKVICKNESPANSEYKVKTRSGKYFFTIGGASRRILQIFSSGQLIRKTRVFFVHGQKDVPDKIRILNPTIKLTLSLTLMDK